MYKKKYKKLVMCIEGHMSVYKDQYLYWMNRDDNDTARKFLNKYTALETLLNETKS